MMMVFLWVHGQVLHCISQLERLQLIGTRGARPASKPFLGSRSSAWNLAITRQDFQFFQLEEEVPSFSAQAAAAPMCVFLQPRPGSLARICEQEGRKLPSTPS